MQASFFFPMPFFHVSFMIHDSFVTTTQHNTILRLYVATHRYPGRSPWVLECFSSSPSYLYKCQRTQRGKLFSSLRLVASCLYSSRWHTMAAQSNTLPKTASIAAASRDKHANYVPLAGTKLLGPKRPPLTFSSSYQCWHYEPDGHLGGCRWEKVGF